MLYVKDNPDTNPGIVFLNIPPDKSFYNRCLREDVPQEEVEKLLEASGAGFVKINTGRGIIGATGAISWHPRRHTYELICYNQPRKTIDRETKIQIAELCDKFQGTFNNMDYRK
ncbi:hypothetical protein B1A_12160 [mine drainage metagenome]|uniref:Uncharacterized protein n=1 Tax=mine drainage metagenome TaxID=410659 RepID=T1BKN1_9ZZZZ